MKKRTFLKNAALMTGGLILPGMQSCKKNPDQPISNWAGNLTYGTTKVEYPKSLDELSAIVKKLPRLKILGTQHCFNTIADSSDQLVSTKNLDQIIKTDKHNMSVTVQPGIKYGTLAEHLQAQGLALRNLASLPHISVAGACQTATHGSGVNNGNLATEVIAFDLMNSKGEIKSITKKDQTELFNALLVNLGAAGIITSLTLAVVPTYQVKQIVYENLPFESLESNFQQIMSSGYSVSLFTDWMNNLISEVWVKSKIGADQPESSFPEFYGAKAATKNMHPIADHPSESCTEQLGIAGAWHDRLPHFKMNFTPSSGKELQSEFFVPMDKAMDALKVINDQGTRWKNDLMISEVRTVAADDLWMSTAYGRPTVAIHFTWKQQENVYTLIPQIEDLLKPLQVRAHWGKLFHLNKTHFQTVYPKFADFKALITEYDPDKKFRNDFLTNVLD